MGASDELGLNSMVLVTDMCIVSGILLHRFFMQANWVFYFLSYETVNNGMSVQLCSCCSYFVAALLFMPLVNIFAAYVLFLFLSFYLAQYELCLWAKRFGNRGVYFP